MDRKPKIENEVVANNNNEKEIKLPSFVEAFVIPPFKPKTEARKDTAVAEEMVIPQFTVKNESKIVSEVSGSRMDSENNPNGIENFVPAAQIEQEPLVEQKSRTRYRHTDFYRNYFQEAENSVSIPDINSMADILDATDEISPKSMEMEETITLYDMKRIIETSPSIKLLIVIGRIPGDEILNNNALTIDDQSEVLAHEQFEISPPVISVSMEDIRNQKLEVAVLKFSKMGEKDIDQITNKIVEEILEDGAHILIPIEKEKQAWAEKHCAKKVKIPPPPKPPKLPFINLLDMALNNVYKNFNGEKIISCPRDADDADLLAMELFNYALEHVETAPSYDQGAKVEDLKTKLKRINEVIVGWRTYTDRNGRNFEPKLKVDVRKMGREMCNTDEIENNCFDHACESILNEILRDAAMNLLALES